MMEEDTIGCCQDGQLTNNEMSGIYRALSVSDSTDIDTYDEMKMIQSCIEKVFDAQFRLIDSEEFQKNAVLLNTKFVELIKYCNENHKYKKVGYIFIGFCDYFDLDFSTVYKHFHEKLKIMIEYSAKCMCGKQNYEKIKQKNSEHPNLKIPTLFDLLNK